MFTLLMEMSWTEIFSTKLYFKSFYISSNMFVCHKHPHCRFNYFISYFLFLHVPFTLKEPKGKSLKKIYKYTHYPI